MTFLRQKFVISHIAHTRTKTHTHNLATCCNLASEVPREKVTFFIAVTVLVIDSYFSYVEYTSLIVDLFHYKTVDTQNY